MKDFFKEIVEKVSKKMEEINKSYNAKKVEKMQTDEGNYSRPKILNRVNKENTK